MILSYPIVNDRGEEYGDEISFKFKELNAVKHMTRWVIARNDDNEREENYEIIQGCCTLVFAKDEFNVKVDYQTIKALLVEYNEAFGV